MKHLNYIVLVIFTAMAAVVSAQDKKTPVTAYGYSSGSDDYIIEPAEYAVSYRRSQLVVNEQTKKQEVLTDTLTLVIGRRWSVFYNTAYDSRFSVWAKQNLKKTRQATKPAFAGNVVPLSSVIDKKNASTDYMEGDFGEPTAIYVDRVEKKTYSVLQIPAIMNEQDSGDAFDWKMLDVRDTVFGYPCRQAAVNYAGRDYTAWYTLDIPVPDGPWKFYGLPGLILKAEDAEGYFVYEAVGMETLDDSSYITMNEDREKVELSYFNKAADNARSERRGTFLFEGEMILTVTRPYVYNEMELTYD